MKKRAPTNHIDAENRALHAGRTIGYCATVVVHCLDGRGETGLVSVQTFYPHEGASDEWLMSALRILADEARSRGLIGTKPSIEAPRASFDGTVKS